MDTGSGQWVLALGSLGAGNFVSIKILANGVGGGGIISSGFYLEDINPWTWTG